MNKELKFLENRWVKKAATIPWDAIEERYAKLFPSKTGMPAKPLRVVLGSLLIQRQLGFSDRELVEELTDEILGEINEMIIDFNLRMIRRQVVAVTKRETKPIPRQKTEEP